MQATRSVLKKSVRVQHEKSPKAVSCLDDDGDCEDLERRLGVRLGVRGVDGARRGDVELRGLEPPEVAGNVDLPAVDAARDAQLSAGCGECAVERVAGAQRARARGADDGRVVNAGVVRGRGGREREERRGERRGRELGVLLGDVGEERAVGCDDTERDVGAREVGYELDRRLRGIEHGERDGRAQATHRRGACGPCGLERCGADGGDEERRNEREGLHLQVRNVQCSFAKCRTQDARRR